MFSLKRLPAFIVCFVGWSVLLSSTAPADDGGWAMYRFERAPFTINFRWFATRSRPESYRFSQVIVYCGILGRQTCEMDQEHLREYVKEGKLSETSSSKHVLETLLDFFPGGKVTSAAGKYLIKGIASKIDDSKPGSAESAGVGFSDEISTSLLEKSIPTVLLDSKMVDIFEQIARENFNFDSKTPVKDEVKMDTAIHEVQSKIDEVARNGQINRQDLESIVRVLVAQNANHIKRLANWKNELRESLAEIAGKLAGQDEQNRLERLETKIQVNRREQIESVRISFSLAALLLSRSHPDGARALENVGTIAAASLATFGWGNEIESKLTRPSSMAMYVTWVSAIMSIAQTALSADQESSIARMQAAQTKALFESLNDLHLEVSTLSHYVREGFANILEGLAENRYSMVELRNLLVELGHSVAFNQSQIDFSKRYESLEGHRGKSRNCFKMINGIRLESEDLGAYNCEQVYQSQLESARMYPWVSMSSGEGAATSILRDLSKVSHGANRELSWDESVVDVALLTPFGDLNPLVRALSYLQGDQNPLKFDRHAAQDVFDEKGNLNEVLIPFSKRSPQFNLPNVLRYLSAASERREFEVLNFEFVTKEVKSQNDMRLQHFNLIASEGAQINKFFDSTVGSKEYIAWLGKRYVDSYFMLSRHLREFPKLVEAESRRRYAALVHHSFVEIFADPNGRPQKGTRGYGNFLAPNAEVGRATGPGGAIALPVDIAYLVPDEVHVAQQLGLGKTTYSYNSSFVGNSQPRFEINGDFEWDQSPFAPQRFFSRARTFDLISPVFAHMSSWLFGEGIRPMAGWTFVEPMRENFGAHSEASGPISNTILDELWHGLPAADFSEVRSIDRLFSSALHHWLPVFDSENGVFLPPAARDVANLKPSTLDFLKSVPSTEKSPIDQMPIPIYSLIAEDYVDLVTTYETIKTLILAANFYIGVSPKCLEAIANLDVSSQDPRERPNLLPGITGMLAFNYDRVDEEKWSAAIRSSDGGATRVSERLSRLKTAADERRSSYTSRINLLHSRLKAKEFMPLALQAEDLVRDSILPGMLMNCVVKKGGIQEISQVVSDFSQMRRRLLEKFASDSGDKGFQK